MSELAENLKKIHESHSSNAAEIHWEIGYVKAVKDVVAYLHDDGYTRPARALERAMEAAKKQEPMKCACKEKELPDEKTCFTVACYGSDGRDAFHSRDECIIKRQS